MNTKNWMAQLNNELTLKQICMPGSHDAGMYHSELFGVIKSFIPLAAKASAFLHTQELDMKGQLEGGVRYFDIRPQYITSASDLIKSIMSYIGVNLNIESLIAPITKAISLNDGNPVFVAHHSIPVGDDISNMLKATNDFIRNNPSETVLLNFSHFEGFSSSVDDKFVGELLRHIDDQHLLKIDYTKKIADLKLSEIRGKVLLILENSYMYENTVKAKKIKGIFNSGTEISIYDDYSNKKSYEEMVIDQMYKFGNFDKKDKLFLLNWTLTPDGWNVLPFASGVHDYANDINPKLGGYGQARDFLFQPNHYGQIVNIVNGDYWNNIGEKVVNVCLEIMNNRSNKHTKVTLKSTATGQALDMKPIAHVYAYQFHGGLHQIWYKKYVSNDVFRLQSAATGLYLRAATENIFTSTFSFLGLKDKNNHLVGALEESGDDNLKWHFESLGNKKYHIVSYRRKKDGDSHDRLDSSDGCTYLHKPNDGKFQIWEENQIDN